MKGLSEELVGRKIALNGLVPHSLTNQTIKIHTGKKIAHLEEEVTGDSFNVVAKKKNEKIPLKVNVRLTKVSENLLIKDSSTPLHILTRASRLAIIGTLGFDMTQKKFYLNAEYLGVDLKEILQFVSLQTTKGAMWMFLGVFIAAIGMGTLVITKRNKDRR